MSGTNRTNLISYEADLFCTNCQLHLYVVYNVCVLLGPVTNEIRPRSEQHGWPGLLYLFILQPMTQNAVHVLVKSLKASIS